MKLKFLMSHHRKNSARDKVIGKKWIYSDSDRSALHRVRAIAEGECGLGSFWKAKCQHIKNTHISLRSRKEKDKPKGTKDGPGGCHQCSVPRPGWRL